MLYVERISGRFFFFDTFNSVLNSLYWFATKPIAPGSLTGTSIISKFFYCRRSLIGVLQDILLESNE